MKAELELDNGDVVTLDFTWEVDEEDLSVGYAGGYFIYPDFYTPIDENTGEPMLPVAATDMKLSDTERGQIESALDTEIEILRDTFDAKREDYYAAQKELRDEH